MKLNKEELALGTIFLIAFVLFIKPIYWLYAIPSALLWAATGAGHSKAFRRIGCPLLLMLALILSW